MPKTKDAFAFRNFDFEQFVQKLLAKNGLKETALGLHVVDADIRDFADMQRAKKSYLQFYDDLKTFRGKIIRHGDRLLKYFQSLKIDNKLLDDDDYYFSIVRPRDKRIRKLSNKYTSLAKKFISAENEAINKIDVLEQCQEGIILSVFSDRLKSIRKAAGLTQIQLAKKTGLTQKIISSYETANSVPSLHSLIQLSREFSRPIDWLLGLS